mgnify:CR=1 FL=1|tara:strand:+ start:742 stop:2127 length:1386 start_codon:yes stop_codon:yes gene_type:complete
MKNKDIQIDFNFSRQLDLQKSIDLSLDTIFPDKIDSVRIDALLTKHINYLLTELYCCWVESDKQFLVVSMSKRGYKANSRYNINNISSKLIDSIKFLRDQEFIEYYPGFFDLKKKISRLTRIKASPKLVEIFTKLNLNPLNLLNNKNRENLLLYGRNLKLLEYRDNFETHEIREIIRNYNSILLKTLFDIPSLEKDYILRGDNKKVLVSHLQTITHRYFLESWNSTGGFSGCWWNKLDLSSILKFHSQMIINNSQTNYCDLSKLFFPVLSRKFKINFNKIRTEILIKNTTFINNHEQIYHLFTKGIASKNVEGFFKSFCNEKNKIGITKKISKNEFLNFLKLVETTNNEVFQRFFSQVKIPWESFVSEIFYKIIKNFSSSPIIKVKDKFYYPARIEENILKYLNELIEKSAYKKYINYVKSFKCMDFSINKKSNFFNKLINQRLNVSKRYFNNTKKYLENN